MNMRTVFQMARDESEFLKFWPPRSHFWVRGVYFSVNIWLKVALKPFMQVSLPSYFGFSCSSESTYMCAPCPVLISPDWVRPTAQI